MAIQTKLRLHSISGSYDPSASAPIHDDKSALMAGETLSDLAWSSPGGPNNYTIAEVLSDLASAVRRANGGETFASVEPGVIRHVQNTFGDESGSMVMLQSLNTDAGIQLIADGGYTILGGKVTTGIALGDADTEQGFSAAGVGQYDGMSWLATNAFDAEQYADDFKSLDQNGNYVLPSLLGALRLAKSASPAGVIKYKTDITNDTEFAASRGPIAGIAMVDTSGAPTTFPDVRQSAGVSNAIRMEFQICGNTGPEGVEQQEIDFTQPGSQLTLNLLGDSLPAKGAVGAGNETAEQARDAIQALLSNDGLMKGFGVELDLSVGLDPNDPAYLDGKTITFRDADESGTGQASLAMKFGILGGPTHDITLDDQVYDPAQQAWVTVQKSSEQVMNEIAGFFYNATIGSVQATDYFRLFSRATGPNMYVLEGYRIAQRIGWAPSGGTAEKMFDVGVALSSPLVETDALAAAVNLVLEVDDYRQGEGPGISASDEYGNPLTDVRSFDDGNSQGQLPAGETLERYEISVRQVRKQAATQAFHDINQLGSAPVAEQIRSGNYNDIDNGSIGFGGGRWCTETDDHYDFSSMVPQEAQTIIDRVDVYVNGRLMACDYDLGSVPSLGIPGPLAAEAVSNQLYSGNVHDCVLRGEPSSLSLITNFELEEGDIIQVVGR